MATITLKINERSKAGQAVLEFLKQFVALSKEVEVVEEKSPYNPEFVKKIKKAEAEIKEGKYTVLDTNDIWGSLGL
jgi:proteasome assembly chaperone (PAC2) family protein